MTARDRRRTVVSLACECGRDLVESTTLRPGDVAFCDWLQRPAKVKIKRRPLWKRPAEHAGDQSRPGEAAAHEQTAARLEAARRELGGR